MLTLAELRGFDPHPRPLGRAWLFACPSVACAGHRAERTLLADPVRGLWLCCCCDHYGRLVAVGGAG